MLPIGLESGGEHSPDTLIVAMSDPTDLNVLDEMRFKTGKRIKAVLAGDQELSQAIQFHYRDGARSMPIELQEEGDSARNPDTVDQIPLVEGKLEVAPEQPGGFSSDPFTATEPLDPVEIEDPFAELDELVEPSPGSNQDPDITVEPLQEPKADFAEDIVTMRDHSAPDSPESTDRDMVEQPSPPKDEDGLDDMEALEILEQFGPQTPSGPVQAVPDAVPEPPPPAQPETPSDPASESPVQPSTSSPAMQKLLSRVGLGDLSMSSLQGERKTDQDAQSRLLLQSLIRLLVRKGLITEDELIQENEGEH
jgi:hypothetical protein